MAIRHDRPDSDRGFYAFETDLHSSKKVEHEFGELLIARGKIHHVEYNDDHRYDLKTYGPMGELTFEVKHDMVSYTSGNLGVEFECRGKPSGISVTKSDFWCFKTRDGFWTMRTDALRDLIKAQLFYCVKYGGDVGSNTGMYLFRSDFLKNHMTNIT